MMEDNDNNSAHFQNKKDVSLEEKSLQETESAEDIVNELIKKASFGEGSSDEYVSAEEEDEADDSYVIKSVNETADVHQEDRTGSLSSGEQEQGNNDGDCEKDIEEVVVDEMEERRKEENSLTDKERMDRREQGQTHKNNGNTEFRSGNFKEAELQYSKALDICPLNFHKERAIMFANRAACKMKEDAFESAIKDSTFAIELHPQYLKAILRRAELYEKTEKLDEALKDYEAVIELDPSHHGARASYMRLQEQIKERNEKLKAEMMGKLKDLGNLVLRPFGLSTNNFKLQQDPNTGSYSMQFQQNPTGNGS